jgi:ArsR family transcriptional regulator
MSEIDAQLGEVLQALKAGADATRLRLLVLCANGELTQGELTGIVDQSQPRVARHLRILCDAGLLDRFREQHRVYYRLARKGPLANLASALLAQLPPGDMQLQLDRQRLDEVRERRAEAANQLMQGVDARWGGARTEQEEAAIRGVVVHMLRDRRIGALLDIGTGTGRMLRLLGRRAEEAVGVDLSRDMLAVARNALEQAGLDHCMVRHANMYRLPFSAGSFDTVTLDEVLGEAARPAQVIAEAARILRPRGTLLIVDSQGQGRDPDEGQLSRYCREAGLRLYRSRVLELGGSRLIVLLAEHESQGQGSGIAA